MRLGNGDLRRGASAVRGGKLLGDLPDVAGWVGEGRCPHAPVPVGRAGERLHAAPSDLAAYRVHVIDDDRELADALPGLLEDLRQRLCRRRGPVQEQEMPSNRSIAVSSSTGWASRANASA